MILVGHEATLTRKEEKTDRANDQGKNKIYVVIRAENTKIGLE